MREYLGLDDAVADTKDDPRILRSVEAASRAVDRYCFRTFGHTVTPVQRYYETKYCRDRDLFYVNTHDIAYDTAGAILVDVDPAGDDTWTESIAQVFWLNPNAAADEKPYTGFYLPYGNIGGRVQVTAVFGWLEVPEAVQSATAMQAARWIGRRSAVFGYSGSASEGSEQSRVEKRYLDGDAQALLRGLRRIPVGT